MSPDGAHETRVARELRRSEERLQSVLDCAYCAYVAIDDAGRIFDWNGQAVATFGYSREEALGKPVVDLVIPPRYRAAHLQGLRKFLETGEGPVLNRRLELAAINRAGQEFPVDMTIWPLQDEQGWTFHALVSDATKLREAQRQAVAMERQAAVGQIITLLTQEARNPLQRIQMWSEILALEAASPTAAQAIREIQEAQARLERLVLDVRGYAAPLRLNPRKIDLAGTWREAWRELCQLHGRGQAELHEELNRVDLHCHADPQAMQQAFYHLLDSAILRGSDREDIAIWATTSSLHGRPAISVSITHAGQPPPVEEPARLAASNGVPDEFSATEPEELAVAIALRIIEAHGGRLSSWSHGGDRVEVAVTLPRQTV